MDRFNKCFVIAQNKAAVLELVAGAAAFAEDLSLVCLGVPVSAEKVNRVYALDDNKISVAAYSSAISSLIKEQKPELVLVEKCRNGRLLAGIVAAALGTSVQTDAYEIRAGENGIVTKRLSYGGLAVLLEESKSNAVVCAGAGIFPPAAEQAAADITLLPSRSTGITMVERKEKTVQPTNLASARRVVGVGRGIKSAESLALIQQFAAELEAELGCTRPVAEEDHLLPASRYIGVSGVTIHPDVYIAVGISGQIQHTAGCDQAGLIFAINKDERAPIFKECDFGIVGDFNSVIPKLLEALARKKDG